MSMTRTGRPTTDGSEVRMWSGRRRWASVGSSVCALALALPAMATAAGKQQAGAATQCEITRRPAREAPAPIPTTATVPEAKSTCIAHEDSVRAMPTISCYAQTCFQPGSARAVRRKPDSYSQSHPLPAMATTDGKQQAEGATKGKITRRPAQGTPAFITTTSTAPEARGNHIAHEDPVRSMRTSSWYAQARFQPGSATISARRARFVFAVALSTRRRPPRVRLENETSPIQPGRARPAARWRPIVSLQKRIHRSSGERRMRRAALAHHAISGWRPARLAPRRCPRGQVQSALPRPAGA